MGKQQQVHDTQQKEQEQEFCAGTVAACEAMHRHSDCSIDFVRPHDRGWGDGGGGRAHCCQD